jgi:hypothetical protein
LMFIIIFKKRLINQNKNKKYGVKNFTFNEILNGIYKSYNYNRLSFIFIDTFKIIIYFLIFALISFIFNNDGSGGDNHNSN